MAKKKINECSQAKRIFAEYLTKFLHFVIIFTVKNIQKRIFYVHVEISLYAPKNGCPAIGACGRFVRHFILFCLLTECLPEKFMTDRQKTESSINISAFRTFKENISFATVSFILRMPFYVRSFEDVHVAPPTQEDTGKIFVASVTGEKDKKNFKLKVKFNGSTFDGMIKKNLLSNVIPDGHTEVKLSAIDDNYKFVLPNTAI